MTHSLTRRLLVAIPVILLAGLLLLLFLRRIQGEDPARRSEKQTARFPEEQASPDQNRPESTEPGPFTPKRPIVITLFILDELGHSPGVSKFCLFHPRLGETFRSTTEAGDARVTLPAILAGEEISVFAVRHELSKLYWLAEKRQLALAAEGDIRWDFHYSRLSEIHGIVKDGTGLPQPQAEITIGIGYRSTSLKASPGNPYGIFNAMMTGKPPTQLKVRTTDHGTFTLSHVSPDIFLEFSLKGTSEAPSQSTITTDLTPYVIGSYYQAKPPGSYSVALTRHSNPVVTVKVIGSSGEPVEDALVAHHLEILSSQGFLSHGAIARTDPSGKANIKLHLLKNEPPDALRGRRQWIAIHKDGAGATYATSPVNLSDPTVTVTLPTTPDTALVSVKVIEVKTREPLEGVPVEMTSPLFHDQVLATRTTGRDGQVTFTRILHPDRSWADLRLRTWNATINLPKNNARGELSREHSLVIEVESKK